MQAAHVHFADGEPFFRGGQDRRRAQTFLGLPLRLALADGGQPGRQGLAPIQGSYRFFDFAFGQPEDILGLFDCAGLHQPAADLLQHPAQLRVAITDEGDAVLAHGSEGFHPTQHFGKEPAFQALQALQDGLHRGLTLLGQPLLAVVGAWNASLA